MRAVLGYRSWLRVALVVVAVAHRRHGPSSSATTSTTDRALPSSADQLRCWSRPMTTTRLPLARDCAACSAWSRQTITVKNDASCSLPARHRDSEHGPGDAALGVADLGVVGEVAGEAHAGLGHGASLPDCLAGRSALPLEPGDGGYRGMPRDHQGQATEPTKSAMRSSSPAIGRLGCRVGWWSACGWGSGMPAPSGQIPPPWAWWENEAPTTRAARRPVPGSSRRMAGWQVGRRVARPSWSR